ncbi:MAG: hypothetical protein JKX75_02000 [Gammaproteobacteria bacterium]|nr:hypothetical protein [Gammaproteobacteria bacterium]
MSWLTLFASTSTLVCCALPIILVTLGMGAAVASLTSAFPFLIFLSLHKTWVFALSGFMLFVSGWFIYRPIKSCPTDPELARFCENLKRWNKSIFWVSVAIWGIGFFAAFVALPLRMALGL